MAYRFKPKGIRRRRFGRKQFMADFSKGFDQLWKSVWPQLQQNIRETWGKLFPGMIPSTHRQLAAPSPRPFAGALSRKSERQSK